MLALIDQGHDVSVITRRNNRHAIQSEIARSSLSARPVYYDLPSWCARWKHWPGGLYIYYLLWQIGAYRQARKLHRENSFDVVHHITFVTFRQPSFMGSLGIPFILGPVGGGESSPRPLRAGMNYSGRLREIFRDLLIAFAARDPLMRRTFSKATVIACTTAETLNKIPARFRNKCIVLPAIGIDPSQLQASPAPPYVPTFLFIGRLLYWKGLHLVLRAMPEVLQQIPNARLRIVGQGKDARWLRQVAESAGIAAYIDWVSELPHNEISAAYHGHAAFVFPSLHDSGGMVVLESLAAQLPVICLDLGGPGVFIDSSCGIVIPTKNQSEASIQHFLATAMINLVQQTSAREALASRCAARARQFSWANAARQLYSAFEQKIRPG
ncbi:MAG TPA: glycosyltransferase family 4 protein [Silvibacterium sp.]|nr:glycosyltransferase family 4 protein [Silvibacterium sp.]